jgi:hypothetical protein
MAIQAFFGESGKFQNQQSISFGGVATPYEHIDGFVTDWDQLLPAAGIETLSMKTALRFEVPLSERQPATGLVHRLDALMPFVECIRRHMMFVSGMAVKSSAFEAAPLPFKKLWGNPIYFSFARASLELIDYAKGDVVMLTCDEDPATAVQMYQLYTRLKQVNAEARSQLKAITFGDDEYIPALQAADLVASLIRSAVRKHFFDESYLHEPTVFSAHSPTGTLGCRESRRCCFR